MSLIKNMTLTTLFTVLLMTNTAFSMESDDNNAPNAQPLKTWNYIDTVYPGRPIKREVLMHLKHVTNPNEALYKAFEKHKIDEFQALLLSEEVDVNHFYEDCYFYDLLPRRKDYANYDFYKEALHMKRNTTLLDFAFKSRHNKFCKEALDLLLAHKDIDKNNLSTLLLQHCRHCGNGYTGDMEMLIKAGADVNVVDEEGDTPLMRAIMDSAGGYGNNSEFISTLIQYHADVNKPNKQGHIPLHIACWGNRDQVITMLLAKGANVNAQDNIGNTPLHYLFTYYHSESTVRALLNVGYIYSLYFTESFIQALDVEHDLALVNNKGDTALDLLKKMDSEYIRNLYEPLVAEYNERIRATRSRTALCLVSLMDEDYYRPKVSSDNPKDDLQ